MTFTAKQARALAEKNRNKVSFKTKRKFLNKIKSCIKEGCIFISFRKEEFANHQAIIKWLESLGYICKTGSLSTVYIYWNMEDVI